ncbi:hypothetical protein RIR_jg12059.t1 [Rhizophagus irregularis DAOM 181602=DAOM 197198]|uniref:Uncharacterized protein n=1 Tax=Rhizophagus irregularis (strain DAOM 181602 / DAOM 197198 / MUCL 43194) TaxID=747089 RepID=A0A2P4QT82_RHIID|nr:hypothetical protein GLOIN_2v1764092 [Rhizophagus irregularis DAOM 181602=DAOM 197198]POG80853.1 hypothetical protein GLOIN_2v1764092 [Rhizophagus irregularis DAOM 181602=DAOM 197198]GBC32663.2 hypothetical protein RIR_jg12059.t1 [Rhizophagus irregularis DAOM 181602=DAOM 197198]|eukprot:XP_025187719.1 hypothetical protein GLOIN_2v1764092 [Rhizophagus irregularis DAOM 181602=DAOM 197198]
MYELGLCHNDGEGVEKDYNKAFKLFKQSTGRGFPGGMMMLLMLGYCYDEDANNNFTSCPGTKGSGVIFTSSPTVSGGKPGHSGNEVFLFSSGTASTTKSVANKTNAKIKIRLMIT